MNSRGTQRAHASFGWVKGTTSSRGGCTPHGKSSRGDLASHPKKELHSEARGPQDTHTPEGQREEGAQNMAAITLPHQLLFSPGWFHQEPVGGKCEPCPWSEVWMYPEGLQNLGTRARKGKHRPEGVSSVPQCNESCRER